MQYTRQHNFTEGTVIDSEQMDGEFNAVQAVINGNIDTDNIADGAITTDKIANAGIERANIKDGEVTNAKLDTTAGAIAGAWTSWTPIVTAEAGSSTLTLGVCKYIQIGKTVHCAGTITVTDKGTGGGAIKITLPITATSLLAGGGAVENIAMGYTGGICVTATTYAFLRGRSNDALVTGYRWSFGLTYEAA
jgi:hypothetical protein